MSYEFNLICLGFAISIAWVWMTDGQEIKDALYKRRVARKEKLKRKEKRKPKPTYNDYSTPPSLEAPALEEPFHPTDPGWYDQHSRQPLREPTDHTYLTLLAIFDHKYRINTLHEPSRQLKDLLTGGSDPLAPDGCRIQVDTEDVTEE